MVGRWREWFALAKPQVRLGLYRRIVCSTESVVFRASAVIGGICALAPRLGGGVVAKEGLEACGVVRTRTTEQVAVWFGG